jgi:hypothetical protein
MNNIVCVLRRGKIRPHKVYYRTPRVDSGHCIEQHQTARGYDLYIGGIPGQYCVKSCGNSRILNRDISTLAAARQWIADFY